MGSRQRVRTQAAKATSAIRVEDKLNAIADAIYELADFVDDLENQLNNIERKLK
jgi:hypothetical protein